MSKTCIKVNAPNRAGLRVAFLQYCAKLSKQFLNKLIKPIVIKRLAPIQIPFKSRLDAVADGSLAARNGSAAPEHGNDEPGEPGNAGNEDDFLMPGGSAGWGPVSGGYWGLDGLFHIWTGGVPPLPPPFPPQPDDQTAGADNLPNIDIEAPGTTTPEDEEADEERRRRIRELEDEMARILEEMHIMWPLLEELLREEFEARRQEILQLDPTWTPPGITAPMFDDDEAPPLYPPENQ